MNTPIVIELSNQFILGLFVGFFGCYLFWTLDLIHDFFKEKKRKKE